MKVKLIRIVDQYTLTQPVTTMVRAQVELDHKHTAYVVCYYHNGHLMYLQGKFFITNTISKEFFDLHCKYADLAVDMTPYEETDYAAIQTRTYEEMQAYVQG